MPMLPDVYYGSLANLAQIAQAKKKKTTTPKTTTPQVTEDMVRAGLGVPVGRIDTNYLASMGAVPSTPTYQSVSQPSTTLPSAYTIQAREPSARLTSLMKQYESAIRQQPITAEDIMSSPEYEAMRKVGELELGQNLAALSRRLSALGTLRGTPAIQAMGAVETEGATRLGALVPQLVSAASARQQQALTNLYNALKAQADIEGMGYSQALQEFGALAPYRYETVAAQRTFPLQEAAVTGMYKGQPTLAAKQAQATQSLSWARLQQEKDYQGYLKQRGLTEQQAQKATNGYISQILAVPTADDAFNYIVTNAQAIVNDGADISKILSAFRLKWPEKYSATLAEALGEE